MPQARKAFDPGDAFDAMADTFRTRTSNMMLEAMDAAVFRDLDSMKQLECFMAGVVTGLIGACFACIDEGGRDEMMRVIENYLPQARENVEDMLTGDGQQRQ